LDTVAVTAGVCARALEGTQFNMASYMIWCLDEKHLNTDAPSGEIVDNKFISSSFVLLLLSRYYLCSRTVDVQTKKTRRKKELRPLASD
jgi:hypothetical protein